MALGNVAYSSWARCGIGSYVVTERISEFGLPGGDLHSRELPPETRKLFEKLGIDLSRGVVSSVITTRTTLVGVTPEYLKLETEITSNVNGRKTTSRNHAIVPAKGDPSDQEPQAWTSEDSEGSVTVIRAPYSSLPSAAPSKSGQEELSVAGRVLTCQWLEEVSNIGGDKAHRKYWFCEKIPGGLARFETSSADPEAQKTTTIVMAFEVK